MSKHPLQKETPYTSPPILPKSESGHELLGLSSRTSNIKNQDSRYHCDEELMKKNRVRDYHQAEQALQRGQYAEAERICYDIVDNGSEKCCSEGIMARANMLLARPEVTKDLKDREYVEGLCVRALSASTDFAAGTTHQRR
ncbi:uncharacterized protein CLAFUR5_10525 [Fulvia fulva]|uniref:Uncharacterized protein n=1 Tax=Passalora fulva TaxID=5499 RepID=A0A9Q8URJ3_PASFU|nr:uncharacterized protein CLAFUR5_10525 [Fulvia fulva]UJO19808.1 hypothetical protein CLAFUR5_10525 [Fulvia fulva]